MTKAWITGITIAAAFIPCRAADPIEGRWNLGNGEAVIDVRPAVRDNGHFEIIWVDGADCSMLPGTPVGTISSTPTPGLYDCRMPIDPVGGTNPKVWEATVTLNDKDPDNLTFGHYERRTEVNMRNLLPRWLRITVNRKDTRPSNLDGGRRVGAPPRFVSL